jgi:hypothetical protein
MRLTRNKISGQKVDSHEGLLSELIFVLGVTISVVLPNVYAAMFGSLKFSILLFISSSLGVMLGFALYVPKVRSFQQQKTFRVLKTQHKEFFEQIRSNVANLIKKGATDERLLPRSS